MTQRNKMQPPSLAMLRAIVESPEGITRTDILRLNTHPDIMKAATCISALQQRRLIESIVGPDKRPRWFSTHRGRAELAKYTTSQPSSPVVPTMATPRQVMWVGRYEPTPQTFTRAGSDAAFKLPSLVGGRLVERIAP